MAEKEEKAATAATLFFSCGTVFFQHQQSPFSTLAFCHSEETYLQCKGGVVRAADDTYGDDWCAACLLISYCAIMQQRVT